MQTCAQGSQRATTEDADQVSQNENNALPRQHTPISPLSVASSRNWGTEQIGSPSGQMQINTLRAHLSPAADNISAPSTVFEDDASTQIAEHSSTCQHPTPLRNTENDQLDSEPQHEHEHEKLTKPMLWNPFWLSPAILISLSTSLALMSAATITLWRLSVQDHGFELLTTNHYAWTYGPTAVLTIIMSIWTRISYWGKILQPWQELKTGPTSAEKSVLLDYISPILPVNLWNAIRLRNFPVQIVIYGGLILKLVTVASTGLLAPVETELPFENITLETSTVFDGAALDTYDFSSNPVSQIAVEYEAYALIADNLPYPDGIEPALAFQQFRSPANSTATTKSSTIRATVEAFRPVIKCETANLAPFNASTYNCNDRACLEIYSSASWAGCLRSGAYPETIDMVFMYSPTERPSRQLYGGTNTFETVICEDSFWVFVAMFDVRYNQTKIPGAKVRSEWHGDSGSWGIQVLPTTAASCSISHSMVDAKVTYDLAQEPLKPTVELPDGPAGERQFLDGLLAADFAAMMIWLSNRSGYLVGSPETNGGDEFAPDTFFELMSIVANKSESEFLGNSTAVSSAASTVFTSIGVQIANQYLMMNSTLPLQGEISIRTPRLAISPLASWLMISGLLSVAVGAMVLVRVRPRDVIPCKVGPISGMATILRASPHFQTILRDSGKLQTKDIARYMRLFTFQSSRVSKLGFSITVSTKSTSVGSDGEQLTKSGMEFWKPAALRPWAFAIISILPITVIVILEVLQDLSGRTDGIAAIAYPDTLLVTFGTRFLPATLFMTLAVLYDSIDFNVAVFAPFAKLKKTKARGKHTLTHTLLGRFPFEVLVSAIYHGNWAAAFATFGALLGSFLTIAASGLYNVEKIPAMFPVTLSRFDQFDPSWPDSVRDDAGAATLLTDFELLNLSYPAWTSSELAFPELRLSPTDMALINSTSRPAIAVRVPAVRGELQCRFSLPQESFLYMDPQGSFLYDDDHKDWIIRLEVNSSTPVPAGCDAETSSIQWSSLLGGNEDTTKPERAGLLGQMLDLHPGVSNDTYGEFSVPLEENSPVGCPSLAFTFGKYTGLDDRPGDTDTPVNPRPDAFTTMWCYQQMAEVQTDITLSIPDFTVTSAVPDESTTKFLPSGPDGRTAFSWRPQLHFVNEVVVWEGNITFGEPVSMVTPEFNPYLTYPNIDGFFALLLYPGTASYVEDMLGADNQDRLLEGIKSLYRRYMAQVASAKMRVLATNSVPETYTAHWENSHRGVLRQSPGSKLSLQIILGVMFACGVAAYLLVETSEVLPHDPCSIAGLASLLAGSSLCSGEVSEQAGGGADQKVFGGAQLFSLGWWPSPGSQEGRFGIDVGEASWMGRMGRLEVDHEW